MSEPSYAYDEDKMNEGIIAFQREQRNLARKPPASVAAALADVAHLVNCAKDILERVDVLTAAPLPAASSSAVIQLVATAFGMTRQQILGRSQEARVCRARFAVMYVLRSRGLSLPHIGRLLHKHHTTVMNGLARVEEMMADDKEFADLIHSFDRERAA